MKKLFLLLSLVGITLLSCSDNKDINIVSSHTDTDYSSSGQLYAAKLINGEIGDEIILNEIRIDSTGREIHWPAYKKTIIHVCRRTGK